MFPSLQYSNVPPLVNSLASWVVKRNGKGIDNRTGAEGKITFLYRTRFIKLM